MRAFLIATGVFLLISPLHGQFNRSCTFYPTSQELEKLGTSIRAENNEAYLRQLQWQLMLHGYFDAVMDSARICDTLVFTIKPGPCRPLRIASLTWTTSLENERLPLTKSHKALSLLDLEQCIDRAIRDAENHGYPFALAQIKHMDLEEDDLSVEMELTPGPLMRLDTVVARSVKPIAMNAIRSALFLRKGTIYQQAELEKLDERLQRIPYIQWRQPSEIQFKSNTYRLFIFAEPKSANRIQAIIGLRPDPNTGKAMLIGDIDTQWKNALKVGEEFSFAWRKLQPQTQDLKVKFEWPFIGQLPIGISTEWLIYKRDSTFASSDFSAGLLFQPEYGTRFKAFLRRQATTSLAASSLGLTGNTSTNYFGVDYITSQLNNPRNPRRGYSILASVAYGNRSAKSSADSEDPVQSKNLLAAASAEYFLPIFSSQCLRVAVQGQTLNGQKLFVNELLRFGGLRTMRGITEESIFCTTYGVGSLEYRWLLDDNSALLAFCDAGIYEANSASGYLRDTPVSAGFGLQLGTKSGIFSLQYGVAKQFDLPINIRNANVSIGYSNTF